MNLKFVATLVLVAAGLILIVYALIQGDLFAAGLLAFFAFFLVNTYRRGKRLEKQIRE